MKRLGLFLTILFWCGVAGATDYCALSSCSLCWKMTESMGTTIQDATASDEDGTLSNITWSSMSGSGNPLAPYQTYKLVASTGTDRYIQAKTPDNSPMFMGTGAFSASGWFSKTSSSSTKLMGWGIWATRWQVLSNNGESVLKFMWGLSDTVGATSASYSQDGTWHHYVLVSNGANSTAFFYIDGVIGSSTNPAGYNLWAGDQDGEKPISGSPAEYGEAALFKGKAFSSTEVSEVYDYGLDGSWVRQSTSTYSIIRNSTIRNSILR